MKDITEATRLVRNLSPDDIRARLLEIDQEAKALRVLLRAANAGKSGQAVHSPRKGVDP